MRVHVYARAPASVEDFEVVVKPDATSFVLIPFLKGLGRLWVELQQGVISRVTEPCVPGSPVLCGNVAKPVTVILLARGPVPCLEGGEVLPGAE